MSNEDSPAEAETASPIEPQAVSLRHLFRENRKQILTTYMLFNIENILRLLQPLVLGIAINDLINQSYRGVMWFVVQHLAHLVVSFGRQMYDTRVFTQIYAKSATRVVVAQREAGVEVSRIAARSMLSREYVDFFELHMPMLIRALYSVVGALLMLIIYDWRLLPVCLFLCVPALFLNKVYAIKTFFLSRELHDHMEHEVDVIKDAEEPDVREHYDSIGYWNVRLSDAEAINFSLMELFVLGMMVGSLLLFCGPGVQAGDIFAVFRYIMLFLMGLDSLPKLVHQVSRLRDIGLRMQEGAPVGSRGKLR